MNRFLRSIAAIAMLLGGTMAQPAAAQASPEKPSAMDCSTAYGLLKNEQRRLYRSISKDEGKESLGLMVPGFRELDFDARIAALRKIDSMVLGIGTPDTLDAMNREAMFASSNATLNPGAVFKFQREMFALARTCDKAYGFKPEVPEAPAQQAVVKYYTDRRDRDIDRKHAESAALDDLQCAVRFWIMVKGASASNPQAAQLRMEKLAFVGRRIMAAQAGMTEERLIVQIEREGTSRIEKLKSKSLPMSSLYDDLQTCERRYGMPLTVRPASD